MVRVRFPALTELAQQQSQQIESLDVLGFILERIEMVASEDEAKLLLRPPAA